MQCLVLIVGKRTPLSDMSSPTVLALVCLTFVLSWQHGTARLTAGQKTTLLDAHTTFRSRVSPSACPALPPMVWNDVLATVAQSYADRCIWGHNPQRTNQVNGAFGSVGENLYAATGTNINASAPTASWNSEVQYYTLESNECEPGKVVRALHTGCVEHVDQRRLWCCGM